MAILTRTTLKTNIAVMVSGTISDTNWNTIINRAVREVVSDVDVASNKRKSALSPNLFDSIYDYTCPTDLKADKIIGIRPQTIRSIDQDWVLTTEEEFDRLKDDGKVDQFGDPWKLTHRQIAYQGANLIAISNADMVKKIRISTCVDDSETAIDNLSAVGDWVVMGDAENLAADSSNYIKGNASLNFDIGSGGTTTAGIVNSSLDTFDITNFLEGSVFCWAYIPSTTNLTNFILRIGSDSSNYYSITITTNNEGTAFVAGWNLLRFDFANKVATGTPDIDACDYAAIYMTKAEAKISETDYRFNWLVMKVGKRQYVLYYSKYGWQSSSGIYLEDSTGDTDKLNFDTDENKLVEYKCAELGERYLRNHGEADRWKNFYEDEVIKYEGRHPSEAMILQTNYGTPTF